MLTNEDFQNIELKLRDTVRGYYRRRYMFEMNSYGEMILQAARVALFITANSYDDMKDILEDPNRKDEFFRVVKRELREPGSELRFMISLDGLISAEYPLIALLGQEVHLNGIIRPDLVVVHGGKVICNTSELLGDNMGEMIALQRGEEHPGDLRPELTKLIGVLEKEFGTRHYDISRVYHKNLAALYEKVRTGKISDWRKLNRHPPFFGWDVNLRGVIRHVTETYILPYYGCSLEDLPLQGGLKEQLTRLKIYLTHRFSHIRDCFTFAYPQLENSPHWHPSRWTGSDSLPQEEHFRFKRDYLFRYRLGCTTMGEVLEALNDEERMKQALRAERMFDKVYLPDGDIKRIHSYTLIKDLEGEMYDLDPWELKAQLPDSTFRNPDGTVNRGQVGRYLLWADKNYGLPLHSLRCREPTKHIPHYESIRQTLSIYEIGEIYNEAKATRAVRTRISKKSEKKQPYSRSA